MPRKRKQGSQPGNQHALQHGAYRSLRRVDGRSWEGKLIKQIELELCTALGGDPTPQQIILLKRISVKALKCHLAERRILNSNGADIRRLEADYLTWANSLRMDLSLLGLKRQAKPVQSLDSYLENQ